MVALRSALAIASITATAVAAPRNRPVLGLANITRVALPLEERAFSGPQLGNFPDPSIIYGDGSWKAYSTSSNGKGVPVATSSDAINWKMSNSDALPDPGPWASGAIWAPDVQKNDAGLYVMYYTAPKIGGNHCIGAAVSNSAMGPFKPQSQPLVCDDQGGGVIDPSGYDDGHNRWLLWKVDGNSLGGQTTCTGAPHTPGYKSTAIRIQKMNRDALTFTGDPAKTILDNQGAANDGVTEAPTLYKVPNGDWLLFYSAHCYSSDDYDIEYAWSSTVDGQYTDRGILARTADRIGIYGPGGLDLDPNGRNALFHGRNGPNQGDATRYLYSATLTINGRAISH